MLLLAVDDDPDDLEFFLESIHSLDSSIDVITARNGVEALEFLRNDVVVLPDYIFLDINMPIMDGKECLHQLRSEKPLRHIPIIMHSTTASAEDQKLFSEHRAYFLRKAVSQNTLTSSLRDLFLRIGGDTRRNSFNQLIEDL